MRGYVLACVRVRARAFRPGHKLLEWREGKRVQKCHQTGSGVQHRQLYTAANVNLLKETKKKAGESSGLVALHPRRKMHISVCSLFRLQGATVCMRVHL